MPPPSGLEVRACDNPGQFLRAAARFYRDDPHWVPPLYLLDKKKVDLARHPFFEHGSGALWLAWRGRELVGRISASRDRLHDEFHGDRVGLFGHFESKDEATAHALLETARTWLEAQGAAAMRGPIDFSTNYRCGLLVAGEPGPPFVLMPHNPPEYAGWLESWGLSGTKDLIAMMLLAERLDLSRMDRVEARIVARTPVRSRQLNLRRFADELELLWSLYNRIWETNWGFAPMSRNEFFAEAKDLRAVLNPRLTVVIERLADDAPIAFAIGIPDVNLAIAACRGRLLPFGWFRFLRTLRQTATFRTITLGVVPEVRGTGIDAVLLRQLIRQGLAAGFPTCEASWILEGNVGIIRPLSEAGGREYRRYRIYERPLGPEGPGE